MAFSLQACVVFPVDRPPIEHGVVTIDGERIVEVSTTPASDHVVDLGSAALLPALVNAHTHLEFSGLAQPLGRRGMPLADWIRLVIAERGQGDEPHLEAIVAGVVESIGHGVACIGEVATVGYPPFNEIDLTQFIEVIGFSHARVQSALAAVTEKLDAIRQSGFGGNVGISPHAPYTVSPELLQQLIELANARHLSVAMHLAESAEELEFLRSSTGPFQMLLEERSMWDPAAVPRGSRPLDYLQLLASAPRSLVIHGNYLDDREREFLAAHRDRMSLVFCPRTHEYFGHSPYPLADLLAAGVHVALGTDSRASNPDLDLLAEMRHVARMHPSIDPHDVLRMGTFESARALGRDDEVGSLTPGKLANLLALPLPAEMHSKPAELLAALFTSGSQPRDVWLRGRKMSM